VKVGSGGSTRDLLNILDMIAKAGAGFKSLTDKWADTTTPHGRLMLTVLGGLAEFERELILARTSDGRTRAKARGVRFGLDPPSASGSHPATRGWAFTGRRSAQLQRIAGDHFKARTQPFRRRKRRRHITAKAGRQRR
jgi:DNA invertase Pin-like site-specific DNA recombinase